MTDKHPLFAYTSPGANHQALTIHQRGTDLVVTTRGGQDGKNVVEVAVPAAALSGLSILMLLVQLAPALPILQQDFTQAFAEINSTDDWQVKASKIGALLEEVLAQVLKVLPAAA